MRKTATILQFACCVALLLGGGACGGGGGDDGGPVVWPPIDEYRGSQAPGDVWTYVLAPTAFTAENLTLGYSYAGGVTTLSNGYLRLTVTSSDDPDLTGKLPVDAYAVEVPGVALIVKPADDDGNVTVCVAVDDTPTAATTYNYVKFPDSDWGTGSGALDDQESWGRATSTISGGGTQFGFLIEYWTMANLTTTPSRTEVAKDTFTADGGWLVPDTGDQRVGITPEGLIVQDYGPDSGGAMGLEAPDAPLGLDALFDADRDFLGFVFEYDTTGDNTVAIWASSTDGVDHLSAGEMVTTTGDFADAVPSAEQVRLTVASELTEGVYRGTLIEPGPDDAFGTGDDGTRPLVLLAGEVAGTLFLFGLIEPDDSGAVTTNFLLVQ